MTVQRKNRQHTRQIDLGSGKYAVIDAEDAARVRPYPWYLVRLRSGKLCAQTYLREKGRKKAMFLQCVPVIGPLADPIKEKARAGSCQPGRRVRPVTGLGPDGGRGRPGR